MTNSPCQGNDPKQNSMPLSPKEKIRIIVAKQNLDSSRKLVKKIAAELNISYLDCAAALAIDFFGEMNPLERNAIEGKQKKTEVFSNSFPPGIRLVRYRLDIGFKHKITADELKKVLVEESGVDEKNIANVRIHDDYTCVDLPDEMPQEIFHHLKTVEINTQKLAIRRLRNRNKKKGNRRFRNIKRNSDNLTSFNQPDHERSQS